jgi:hypothetical protein
MIGPSGLEKSRKPIPICTMFVGNLKNVLDYYEQGGDFSPNKSELIKRLHLNKEANRGREALGALK